MKNFIAFVVTLFLLLPAYGFTEIKDIITEGDYNMGDGETPSVAESRALLNAKRIALEQAGTYIESYSKVKNFQLVEDQVKVLTGTVRPRRLRHGGDRAFYRRPTPEGSWPHHTAGDFIGLPPKAVFTTVGAYYETALHELAHWSELRTGWDYSKQGYPLSELAAEIGSCYLSQELGVPNGEALENHAKIILLNNGKDYITMEGSANFTANPRIEQNTVCNSRQLYEFHKGWMDEILSKK